MAAVAADNATIVGWGYNPQGELEAFLVNLGPPSVLEVPALSNRALPTFAGLIACVAFVGLRWRGFLEETAARSGLDYAGTSGLMSCSVRRPEVNTERRRPEEAPADSRAPDLQPLLKALT